MATHILKTWPNAFDAVASGVKRFEWRLDDRGFDVGDVLILRKWNPAPTPNGYGIEGYVMVQVGTRAMLDYTELRVKVTYILRGAFGVPPNYCVMSIEKEGAE